MSSHQKSSQSPLAALISTQSSPPSRVAWLLGSPRPQRVKRGARRLLTSTKLPSCTKSTRPTQALASAVGRQGIVSSAPGYPGVGQCCGQTGYCQQCTRLPRCWPVLWADRVLSEMHQATQALFGAVGRQESKQKDRSLSREHPCHTPSITFRHLPPNSARFSYASEGVLFISAQLSSDAVSALRKVWVLI